MIGISTNLLQSSRLLLQASLDERRGGVWRSKENHATWYAPGVVVMIATALDAWLTELLASGRLHLDISAVYSKYERAAELLFGTRIRASTDLEYVSKVRNEVVHFLPYTQDITKRTVPDWLQYLDGHDLLIKAKKGAGVDFHFSQKLGSYRIAYWACETVYAAVQALEKHARQTSNVMADFIRADNFCVMAGIHSPDELPKYDKDHGLTITT